MTDRTPEGPRAASSDRGWIEVERGPDRALLEACVTRLRDLYACVYDFRITPAAAGQWQVLVRHRDPLDG